MRVLQAYQWQFYNEAILATLFMPFASLNSSTCCNLLLVAKTSARQKKTVENERNLRIVQTNRKGFLGLLGVFFHH